MNRSKLGKRIIIVLALIISFFCFIYFGCHFMHQTVHNMSTMKEGPEYYCYFHENDTNKVYGIPSWTATRWSNKIDAMLSYYDYKFKGISYEFSDISFIASIPNNKKVTVQEFIRDSSVVLVAYPEFSEMNQREMIRKLYVPKYILHETSLQTTNREK